MGEGSVVMDQRDHGVHGGKQSAAAITELITRAEPGRRPRWTTGAPSTADTGASKPCTSSRTPANARTTPVSHLTRTPRPGLATLAGNAPTSGPGAPTSPKPPAAPTAT